MYYILYSVTFTMIIDHVLVCRCSLYTFFVMHTM